MWILLPPIFVICGVLALAAPLLAPRNEARAARKEIILDQAVIADQRLD